MTVKHRARSRVSFGHAVLLLAGLFHSACSKSPVAPAPPALKVISISPPMGSTTGGTAVTVTGTEFSPDATLTVGGVAATNVVVQSTTLMTAVLGPHPAPGAGDVVVASTGKSAVLNNGFTFYAPTGSNLPPVITGIRSVGSRPNQPSGFADFDETIQLVPTVVNAESGVTLTYAWSGPGTFSSTMDGTTSWRVPAGTGAAPVSMTVQLVVTETFAEGAVSHVQTSAPGTFVVQVHDSTREVLDMGEDFLTLFSQSNIPTSLVLHNFSPTCDGGAGRAEEENDVNANRRDYIQDFAAFRITRRTPFSINFRGACFVSDGRIQKNTDACASYAVHWEVINKSNGARGIANGIDFVSAVVENNQWKLCHSSFVGTETYPSLGITRMVSW
jgi:hypothetical protein